MSSADLAGFINTLLLRVAPRRTLARLLWRLARVRAPGIKNMLIRVYARRYRVDLSEAALERPDDYPHFNAFFTRALRPGARPLVPGERNVALPVDGVVSACGEIDGRRLIQAKGIDYTLEALLGGADGLADAFRGGQFATLYLSPRVYHRVHMPLEGTLNHMRYLPGQLFSVNDYSTRHVRGLFTRNERLVTVFDGPAGPMAVIMVGAIFVAAMETVWSGGLSRERPWGHWRPEQGAVRLARGEELGRFNVGSTVIVLFGPGRVQWAEGLRAGAEVRMGGPMGRVLAP
jgi:phosphatidylserine decarboxylase